MEMCSPAISFQRFLAVTVTSRSCSIIKKHYFYSGVKKFKFCIEMNHKYCELC